MSVDLYGKDLFGEVVTPTRSGPLAEKFLFPPFSVLNAREGEWQDRKRAWIALGIKSELGRGEELTWTGEEVNSPNLNFYRDKNSVEKSKAFKSQGRQSALQNNKLSPGGSPRPACDYSKGERGDGAGRPLGKGLARCFGQDLMKGENPNFPNKARANPDAKGGTLLIDQSPVLVNQDNNVSATGTSIFDPVLCECIYRWFCPEGGQVIDPFAGGSVRGIVASILGLKYWGCDLSGRQIQANVEQGDKICPDNKPLWVCGDALEQLDNAPEADLIFSCPPYGDLEVYSDDPRDISTMDYHAFIAVYKRIILRASKLLKPGGMACYVVGDFRDKKTGYYRGFVADTILAFREVGLPLYNDAILVTCVGSLPIRVSAQFDKGRKLGKTHQNVLIFKKP
jgi:hypothetical protein